MRRLLLLTVAVFAFAPAAAQAADRTSTGDGNWLSPGTWANCGGGIPTLDDTVEINGDRIYLISDLPGQR